MTAPATTPSAPPRGALGFIFATVAMDMLGIGLLIPVIPYLVRPYSSNALTVGLLTAAYAIAQFFAAPVLGALSDRIGRRPVLVLSVAGSAVGYLLFGLGGALWVLFVSRILDGITGGNVTAAWAYVADVTTPADRSKGLGMVGAAFGIGFILGPALGGVLSHISIQTPAYAAAGVATLTALLGWFVLPESLPKEKRRHGRWTATEIDPFRVLLHAMRRKAELPLFLAVFLQSFAMAALQSNFALYGLTRFGMGPDRVALYLTLVGVCSAVVQGALIRPLSKRFSDRVLAQSGLWMMVVGFSCTAFAPIEWWMALGTFLTASGVGVSSPTLSGMVSRAAAASEQGLTFGALQAVRSITFITGPLFAGWVFDWLGAPAPYWIGAGLLAASSVAVLRDREAR